MLDFSISAAAHSWQAMFHPSVIAYTPPLSRNCSLAHHTQDMKNRKWPHRPFLAVCVIFIMSPSSPLSLWKAPSSIFSMGSLLCSGLDPPPNLSQQTKANGAFSWEVIRNYSHILTSVTPPEYAQSPITGLEKRSSRVEWGSERGMVVECEQWEKKGRESSLWAKVWEEPHKQRNTHILALTQFLALLNVSNSLHLSSYSISLYHPHMIFWRKLVIC